MNRWYTEHRVLAALAFLALVVVISNRTYEKRQQDRAILEDRWEEYGAARLASGRYVDIGVRLTVVVTDEGLLGKELLPGKPRVRIANDNAGKPRSRLLGGILDRKRGEIVCRSRDPITWYVSDDQEAVVLHSDDDPLGSLVTGSEGSGKTRSLGVWHYCRWLECLGERREGGQTAPTKERLAAVRTEMFALYPSNWYRHFKSKDIIEFVDKTRIRLRATKAASKESGSPIQGWNWSWCGRDEGQDQTERHGDIQARGRAAKDGRYKQLITATSKDSAVWRAFREMLVKSGQWLRRTLLGTRSPFVAASFWEDLKGTLSNREYRRRVLAEDLPPELAVFYSWDRSRNLVALPRIATDVTSAVLANYQSYTRAGARFALLAGHDPGVIYNTTTFHKLLMFGAMPTWVVVGEVQTKQTTARDHARIVRDYVQKTFGFEKGPDTSKVCFFVDPHGKGNAQTDYQSVYMAFQKEGLDVFSPSTMAARINRAPRIELTNRLLSAYNGTVRLVVAANENGQPLAPVLVAALESLEKKPGDDDPEGHQRKDETDQTHAPAATGYALWPFEQEAFTENTVAIAIAAARRYA